MIKNKAMLFIAAILSVGAASTVALPAVSHNKNIVLQANRTIKKNSVTVSSYSLNNKTVKGTFTITKSVNLNNPNNGISIGTNPDNPALMNQEFNGQIKNQNGKVYNLYTFTGVLPAGTYTYTLSNIPANAEYVTFELASDNGNLTSYQAILPKPLIDNLKTSNYDANKGTADLEFNLISSLNLGNENNSILFGTDLNNPGLMCKQFNEVIVYQNGTEYNMNTYTGVLPAGKYTAKLTNIPSNSKLIKAETMDNGTFLDYNTSL